MLNVATNSEIRIPPVKFAGPVAPPGRHASIGGRLKHVLSAVKGSCGYTTPLPYGK